MPTKDETLDHGLLVGNRTAFILRSQRIIEIVLRTFIGSGMFSREEFSDLQQSVSEEFIRRIPLIERNYNGTASMATYVNAVVRNICLDIHQRRQNTLETVPLDDVEQESEDGAVLTSILVNEELHLLQTALGMFNDHREKTTVCLKIFFKLPVQREEIQQCSPLLPSQDIDAVYRRFSTGSLDTNESEDFDALAPYMNRQESKTTSGASLRRWTQEQLTRIIAVLNTGRRRSHTKETIGTLLELTIH